MICPNCGAYLTTPLYSQHSYGQQYSSINIIQQEELKKKNYRLIGIILIIVGVVLIPFVYLTFFIFVSWFVCGATFICIFAGIIVVVTNLTQ